MGDKFTPLHYITVILVAGLVITAVAAVWNQADPNTISVSGYVEMVAESNEAEIYLGTTRQAPTAAAAQAAASSAIDSVIGALVSEGVPESNIETYYFRVNPRYDWSEERTQEIIGYDASHMLKVTTKELSEVGAYITAAVQAGANDIDRVSYGIDDDTEAKLKRDLLSEAALDAREKANALAGSLGVIIVRVRSASESVNIVPVYRYGIEATASPAAAMPPGKVELSGTASITYEIF
jgi:uncharacterized protein YggE